VTFDPENPDAETSRERISAKLRSPGLHATEWKL